MLVQYVIAYLIYGGEHNKYVPKIKRFMVNKFKARKIQQSVYVLDYMPTKIELKKIVNFFEKLKKEKTMRYVLLRRIPDKKILETELAKMAEGKVFKPFIVVAYDIPSSRKNRKSAVYEFIRYRMLSLAGARVDYSAWIFPDDPGIRSELKDILEKLLNKYGAKVMLVDGLLPNDAKAYAEIIDLIVSTKEDMYNELKEKFNKLLEKKKIISTEEDKKKLLRSLSVLSSKIVALYGGIMQVEKLFGINIEELKNKVKKLYDDVEKVKQMLMSS